MLSLVFVAAAGSRSRPSISSRRKLEEFGLEKVVPDDKLLEETYRAFHHSDELREAFEEAEREFKATEITVPEDLREQVRKILEQHQGLRWDDAVRNVLGDTIDDIEADKQKVKKAAGDFTDAVDDDDDEDGEGDDDGDDDEEKTA